MATDEHQTRTTESLVVKNCTVEENCYIFRECDVSCTGILDTHVVPNLYDFCVHTGLEQHVGE